MSIESLSGTQLADRVVYGQGKFADGEVLLLAVSLGRTEAAQQSLLAKASQLGALLEARQQLDEARQALGPGQEQVVAAELEAVDAMIAEMEAAKEEGLPVGQTPEGEPDAFALWAAARDMPVATYVPEPDPQTDPPTPAVGDPEAYDKNLAVFQQYKDDLQAGTADNDVLRDLISKDPGAKSANAELAHLGKSNKVVKLADYKAVESQLGSERDSMDAQMDQLRDQLQALGQLAMTALNDLETTFDRLGKDSRGLVQGAEKLTGDQQRAIEDRFRQLDGDKDSQRLVAETLGRLGPLAPDGASKTLFKQLGAAEQAAGERLMADFRRSLALAEEQQQNQKVTPVLSLPASDRRIRV